MKKHKIHLLCFFSRLVGLVMIYWEVHYMWFPLFLCFNLERYNLQFFTTQPPPGENFQQQQTIQQHQNIPQQHDAGGNFIGWVPLQVILFLCLKQP